MKAFFIGAGASQGTLGGKSGCPPVAAEFGRMLAERCDLASDFPALAMVVAHLGVPLFQLGLEQIWTCIDYYAKLSRVMPVPPVWCGVNASRDLRKALLRLYGRSCDQAAEQLPISHDYTLGHVLGEQVQSGDIIISFNYDTLIERLAIRFGHKLRMVCSSMRPDIVHLAKPHGSTSWVMDFASRTVTTSAADGSPLIDSLAEEDVERRREPLVLGAVPIKSELIREVQVHYGWPEVFEVVVTQWRAVVAAVRDAAEIIVVGYGFPSEDQYGRFLLREAARLRSSPLRVEYYQVRARAGSTAASIIDAFGTPGIQLNWRGEVEPPVPVSEDA
ncbi:MAG: hypothetical protein AB1714_29440 [Acidobacteriota bacterium]